MSFEPEDETPRAADEERAAPGSRRRNSWSPLRPFVRSRGMPSQGLLPVVVAVWTVALSTCHAPLRQVSTLPSPTEPPALPEARVFDPSIVAVDPSTPLGRLRHTLERDPAQAVELARELLDGAHGAERTRLAWVGARAAERAGMTVRAAELFAEVASSDSVLGPWARLERARLQIDSDPALAASEATSLADTMWAGRRAARELRAVALLRAGRPDEAESLLRALVDEAPSASVAMPLAELLAARDEPEAKVEAVRLFRRVARVAPLSRVGRDAETRAGETLAAMPAHLRAEAGDPSPEEALARAQALSDTMQHAQAAEAFAAVARATEDRVLRCRARLGEARAIYNARDRRRAARMLDSVADDCDEPDVRAWARFLAGRALTASGDPEGALEQYAALEREVPDHRLADDARFRSALIDADRGDFASMTERLRTLPDAYPQGDMHGEARFMLAWRARREGRLEEALEHLEASLRAGTGETAEDIRGRAAYWHACVLAELGRTEQAREAWTRLVEELPLSYYSQQAIVRLRELSPDAAESARAALGSGGSPGIKFAWRPELDAPAFARAVELFIVGETSLARDELAWVREESMSRDDELRWIEAALLDRAGAYPTSVWLTRRELASFRERPPVGEHYAKWRIAYPKAYEPLIDQAAEERSLPPALVRAIAREESSFRPDAVSVAHAYGLVQLIVPTARRFGRAAGLEATPRTLTDPHVNVTIGTEFMRWLWSRYEMNPAVLPSAYNAGQGATDRWLRERPTQRLDEWIEDIPYDETRRYSRRVLQSWGIYTWLDRGELPELRPELPSLP